MLLTGARITNYRSVIDSTELVIEPDVTCLVGKNESGKTAVLQAMYKSNPVDSAAQLNEIADFPIALSRQRRQWAPTEQIPVCRLTFRFAPADIAAIEEHLGDGVLASHEFHVVLGYRGTEREIELWTDEAAAVRHLRSQLDVPLNAHRAVAEATTIADFHFALSTVENPPGPIAKLAAVIDDWPEYRLDLHIIEEYIRPRLPRMAYFADYDIMPGVTSIPDLVRRRDAGEVTRGERALLSLLDLAGIRPEAFLRADHHEQLVRDLESAANAISDEVFAFWSQNDQLDVTLAVLAAGDDAADPQDEGPILQIRLRDRRHRASLPFDERSRGFVWFFSFLAYVTELERSDKDLILLLDEPGVFLHGRAQQDLLRLITERLAPRHQVVYTTHSPFMISPDRLGHIRAIADSAEHGSTISAELTHADRDTTAPLVTAMAVEFGRTLLTAEHTLLVDCPSDLIHLDILSSLLDARGRPGLDRRWTPTPVGGAHRLGTLTTLLGTQRLDAALLATSETTSDVRYLDRRRIVEIGEFTGSRDADVEDLYDLEFYLALVNHAYADHLPIPITAADLGPDEPRVARRVQAYFAEHGIANGLFNRFHAAATLLRVQSAFLPEIDALTLTRAERLFSRVNELLP